MLVSCSKSAYFNPTLERGSSPTGLQNLLDVEMFCLLLERMELSKGFINFEKRTFKPHTSKITLLPNK
jgi:hypothetical protein